MATRKNGTAQHTTPHSHSMIPQNIVTRIWITVTPAKMKYSIARIVTPVGLSVGGSICPVFGSTFAYCCVASSPIVAPPVEWMKGIKTCIK